MLDLFSLALTVLLFAATAALVFVFDRLGKGR